MFVVVENYLASLIGTQESSQPRARRADYFLFMALYIKTCDTPRYCAISGPLLKYSVTPSFSALIIYPAWRVCTCPSLRLWLVISLLLFCFGVAHSRLLTAQLCLFASRCCTSVIAELLGLFRNALATCLWT